MRQYLRRTNSAKGNTDMANSMQLAAELYRTLTVDENDGTAAEDVLLVDVLRSWLGHYHVDVDDQEQVDRLVNLGPALAEPVGYSTLTRHEWVDGQLVDTGRPVALERP